MTKLEAILRDADSLSPAERSELVAILSQQEAPADVNDELAAGLHGLAAWTQSTRNESWEEFYPEALQNGRGPAT